MNSTEKSLLVATAYTSINKRRHCEQLLHIMGAVVGEEFHQTGNKQTLEEDTGAI